MSRTLTCDLAIVGGGLAGSLIALAMAESRPDVRVLLIERDDRLGGNHLWSFFGSDVERRERWLLTPLVSHAWPEYDIAFPAHARTLKQPYYTVRSDRLDEHVRATLPAEAMLTGRRVLACSPTTVVLADGARVEAGGVIDARGVSHVDGLEVGWQKFVGCELSVPAGHGRVSPIVMDARVEQIDGYRFVYTLPFSPTEILVEDTYYSDTPDVDEAVLAERIESYAAARGWDAADLLRWEIGALPVVLGGDFERYWEAGGAKVAKAGARAGLFHPTTGYSLPDAVRTALLIARTSDLSGAALHQLTHDYAAKLWAERRFYRLLNRMLFRAAEPGERYRVLERFYRLSPALVSRFYAGRSTAGDKLRILAGKPPVPVLRAISALKGAT